MTERNRPLHHISDTKRLFPLLPMMANGDSNEEIAGQLGLKPDGVKDRVRSLLFHLDARNRAHAVSIAYRRGLLSVATGTLIVRRPVDPLRALHDRRSEHHGEYPSSR